MVMKSGKNAPKVVDSDGGASKPPLFYQTERAIARSFFRFERILSRFFHREKISRGSDSCGGGEIAI
jgi:hypothetical protein